MMKIVEFVPNLSKRKDNSNPEFLKSPTIIRLQIVQPESQSEGHKPQLKATELPQDQTESDGPKSQTMKLEPNEISETHPKSKELMLERYVRRHHAPN